MEQMNEVNVLPNEEVIYIKNANEQEIKLKKNQFSKFIFFINIFSFITFSGLFILSWLSLIWLHKYNFVFTIYKFEKAYSSSFEYFPIQVSSTILYSIIIFTLISITITYFYYLKAIICYKNYDSFNDKNRNYIIPISLNLFLFYIGELTHNKSDIFYIYYFIGFFSSIISLFYLIRLYFDFDYENDTIDFNNYIKNTLIYEFFYGALIALDMYYLFYVICQIIFFFNENIAIKIFMGIIVNLFMGIASLYIGYKLKNMVFALIFAIIYNGIIIFHFTFTEKERKKINLKPFEVILSGIFLIGFVIELIYIFIYKKNKNNNF